MFDIGFSEMLVIGVVALVVIGPERLPSVARVPVKVQSCLPETAARLPPEAPAASRSP